MSAGVSASKEKENRYANMDNKHSNPTEKMTDGPPPAAAGASPVAQQPPPVVITDNISSQLLSTELYTLLQLLPTAAYKPPPTLYEKLESWFTKHAHAYQDYSLYDNDTTLGCTAWMVMVWVYWKTNPDIIVNVKSMTQKELQTELSP